LLPINYYSQFRAVPNVSSALRAEFARGDGRVKRKEDERRQNIQPSETLFVVNFHEETTKKGDLEMLFGPFGELVRIDMKVSLIRSDQIRHDVVEYYINKQCPCSTFSFFIKIGNRAITRLFSFDLLTKPCVPRKLPMEANWIKVS
jgi:hypothetical protein